jgi:hypothetical protein
MRTVWVYVNTSAEVGDVDHLQVFAGEAWPKRPRSRRRRLASASVAD